MYTTFIRAFDTWLAFLTVPMFSLFLSLRNQVPWYRRELVGYHVYILHFE
jgi:hypothetical protein